MSCQLRFLNILPLIPCFSASTKLWEGVIYTCTCSGGGELGDSVLGDGGEHGDASLGDGGNLVVLC